MRKALTVGLAVLVIAASAFAPSRLVDDPAPYCRPGHVCIP